MRATVDPQDIDIAAIRATIESGQGPAFWQSLDAVAQTPAFKRFIEREYPAAAHLAKGPDRRGFFKLMAASFAMAGLAACDNGDDGRSKEVPYVRQPEGLEPGVPLSYASTSIIDGFANGVLVTTVNGRPIKIEGNPEHPWSRGGTDIFAQASVLGLYDPARSQTVRYLNRIASWDAFRAAMIGPVAALREGKGRGLRILSGPLTGPSLIAQIHTLMKDLPEARWHMMPPVSEGMLTEATQKTFGRRLATRWHFERTRVVVSIDGDFLDPGPGQVGLSRAWMEAREASAANGHLLTLHAVASTPNLTSAKADYHLAAEPSDIVALVGRLAAAVDAPTPASDDKAAVWLNRAAAALRGAKGSGIVLAGAMQSVAVHEAVHRLNQALGNIGKTVAFADPVLPESGTVSELVSAMAAGEVSTLLMLETNPVYATLGDIDFAGALTKVKTKIHAGLYVEETALRCDWHLPLTHPLECWGDARAVDGTVSLIQPTIRPLYDGRSASEIISLLFDAEALGGQAILRAYWQGSQDAAAYEPVWRKALLDGFFADSALPELTAMPVASPAAVNPGAPLDIRPDTVTLLFRPDPTIWDGSLAANGWLQELPKPLTKIVWENVAAISPALAQKSQLANGDIVSLVVDERSVEVPVWIVPGQASRSVTLTLGYGRRVTDAIFDGIGYDANLMRSSTSPWLTEGATLVKTGRKGVIATTQDHNSMEGHDFIRIARDGDAPMRQGEGPKPSLYGGNRPKDDRAWGMVIDTDRCIGCNACVVACQSENNIAIVGKEQVAMGRSMHWLRVDRYYSSAKTEGNGLDDPDTHFQPIPCMHCELAPCEVGCPVEATLHDSEGLNLMVYNRCVGTRACSGYCPYKVRHFNYLDYSGGAAPSIQAQRNPDVTVRSRGVMEKCTFCVQRIAEARIASDKTGEPIKDNTVQTACQGACPTRAITFGDLADGSSAVAAKRGDPRNYDLLGELNVRPRTTYLAERAPRQSGKEG